MRVRRRGGALARWDAARRSFWADASRVRRVFQIGLLTLASHCRPCGFRSAVARFMLYGLALSGLAPGHPLCSWLPVRGAAVSGKDAWPGTERGLEADNTQEDAST